MAPAIKEPATSTDAEWAVRLDGFVQRAQEASTALRELDQDAVDRIVWAMTVAGLENAVELAELAMEETQFGVFEDKVLKNYIATEFLYDYLKGQEVGRRDRRGPGAGSPVRRRADRGRARAAADHESDVDDAVQVDRLRQDPERADHASVTARGAMLPAGR